MTEQAKMEVKALRQKRSVNSLWVLVLMVVIVILYRYSDDAMRWLDPQAASLGIEVLQPAIVAMIYVCGGMVFATLMAAFMEQQVRETSFGSWSRFGLFWSLAYLGYVLVAAAIL